MRIFLLTAFAFVYGLVCAQNDTTKCAEYATIMYIDSLKKEEIFPRCLQWINTVNKDSQMVVENNDKPHGIILVKARFNHKAQTNSYDVNYTMKIQVKDGRLKFELFNFANYRSSSGGSVYQGLGPLCTPYRDKQGGTMKAYREQVFAEMVNKSKVQFDSLSASLKKYLTGQ